MKKILFILCVMLFVSCGSSSSDSSSSGSSSDDVTLNANISKSGTQLIIKNNDVFDWTNVEITLNDDWSYKTSEIKAMNKLSVGFLLFTKSDGEKFNPFTHTAKDISIVCKVGDKFAMTTASFQ